MREEYDFSNARKNPYAETFKENNLTGLYALQEAQRAFEGFAEENALENEDDVIKMVKEIRKEKSLR